MAKMKPTYIFLTAKAWHEPLFEALSKDLPGNWIHIKEKDAFTFQAVSDLNPEWIFIPHWSHIIPESIFENFRCVVFHMTDLPYGRGGSPLQNLIVAGKKETVISAIKVDKGLDTGDIYLKRPLTLDGTAQEIFLRATPVIGEMIHHIIKNDPLPQPQVGEPTHFKRRKPAESNLHALSTPEKIYDYIRMLDCDGYPHAFIETEHFKFEFTRPVFNQDQTIEAHVRIIKK